MNSWNQTIVQALGRHPVHPFPARMAPGIAFDALSQHPAPLRILDPMMGSGTVLAVARSCGHRAYGCDLDPLAVMMADVWTTTIDQDEVFDTAKRTLSQAKQLFSCITARDAYPVNADEETKRFIRYWFDDYARKQLACLATTICRVRQRKVRNLLWIAFSRLIISKQSGASRAMDLSHSRPHRVFDRAPSKPFTSFCDAVSRVVANCPQDNLKDKVGPPSYVRNGDARNLKYPSNKFDLVITSPPYLNAIDYVRCSKFSLVWMGYPICKIRELRGISVGSEASLSSANDNAHVNEILAALQIAPHLPSNIVNRLRRYIHDMTMVIGEVTRVLKESGRAIVVVGDSSMRGTYVRNSEIVTIAADHAGLSLDECNVRTLPPNRRYLPPPKASGARLDGRMRKELVLSFRK